MIILPLGLVGVFPTVYKTQRKIRKISPFIEGEKRLSLDTKIFNTCDMFHLLTNTSNEYKEVSPFLEGEKETIFRHQYFQHLRNVPLVDKYLKGK